MSKFEKGTRYWWLNEESQQVLNRGYLLKGETVEQAVDRVTTAASKILYKPHLQPIFKEIIEKGWMSLSSPVWSNMGTGRGLPISCVTGDTWINTQDGGKKAKDIAIGDMVLTHKNRFRKVCAIMPTKDKDDIWKLKVGTRMTDLYITGNHPVLTNLGWVRVDELDPNKHLVAVNGELEYEPRNYTIDLKNYADYKFIVEDGLIKKAVENKSDKSRKSNHSETHVTYFSTPNEYIEIDEDLAWALGLWFADGSLSICNNKKPNGVRITSNVNDKDIAEKWLDIITSRFNLNGKSYESKVTRNGKEHKWLQTNVNGKVIGNFFSSFGEGSKDRVIPEFLQNLPTDLIDKFIEGILIGDGTINGNSCTITLSNPQLLLGLYNMGLKTGRDMSLQMQVKVSEKLSSIPHVYSLVFRNYVNSTSRNNVRAGIKFNDGLTYCPIIILEKTDKVEDVYDFTVDEDHSFSCSGVVVHNCFNVHVPDSIEDITKKLGEVIIQTKIGGGTSGYFGELRGRGAAVTDNGESSGAVSFMKLFDTTMDTISQGGIRRGSFAAYLDIDHPDIEEFLQIRDIGNPLQNLLYGITVPDWWMKEMVDGDMSKRELWAKVIASRQEKGLPYIFYTDNVNRGKPEVYKDLDLTINASNLCSEIALPSSKEESFVCCLSSMNLELYDEWKDTEAVKYAIYFLDAVMQEFINKTKGKEYLEAARNFAKRHRALGLGVMGWHSYLQKNMIPFESLKAKQLSSSIFKQIEKESKDASLELAEIYGHAPIFSEVSKGFKGKKYRNTTTMAIAPTTSSSSILGQVSPGIEPFSSNYYKAGLAKGNFIRKNKHLTALLEKKGKNDSSTWRSIMMKQGSVQHLDFLTDEEKDVFKTFKEVSQYEIILQASIRQKFIDQAQSLNLNIPPDIPVKEVNKLLIDAWKLGVKTLYYQRSQSVSKELLSNLITCISCEG